MQEHPTAEERVEQVQSLTGGYGADVVLEVTGVPAAFLEALQLARPGGRVVEIGNVSLGKEHEVSLAPASSPGRTCACRASYATPALVSAQGLRFLERKHRDHPFELSDQEYALEDAGKAIELEEARKVARPAIVPT